MVHHPFLTVVEHGLGLKTAVSVLHSSEILFWNNAHVFCFVFLTSCLCGIPAVLLVGTSRDPGHSDLLQRSHGGKVRPLKILPSLSLPRVPS